MLGRYDITNSHRPAEYTSQENTTDEYGEGGNINRQFLEKPGQGVIACGARECRLPFPHDLVLVIAPDIREIGGGLSEGGGPRLDGLV